MKRRAILCNLSTSCPISNDWTPSIDQEEMDRSNERLADSCLNYRWRWLGTLVNLHESLNLHAAAYDAAFQLRTTHDCL